MRRLGRSIVLRQTCITSRSNTHHANVSVRLHLTPFDEDGNVIMS